MFFLTLVLYLSRDAAMLQILLCCRHFVAGAFVGPPTSIPDNGGLSTVQAFRELTS